jgi:YidC/Oxa1 family membrane protein insertase
MLVVANILQPLIDVNEAILRFWHNSLGFGWGASIIGLTIVIRLAILPLTFKQVRSMQALQRLQPEMKKIQARFKDDKQRQQQAMMEFYKEHQVNPLGSCLPLLLQFPFFIGLYQTLRSAGFKEEVRPNGQFLFIPDITKPLTGHTGVLVVMIVIYVGTQLLSSYVSSFNVQDKNQKRLLFLFPFLFVPVVIGFQSGLIVYWITTNTWTIGQQLFVRKFLPAPEPHVAGEGKAAGKTGGLLGGARAAAGGGGGGDGGDGKPSAGNGGKASARGGGKAGKAGGAKARGGSNGSADGGPQKAPPKSPRKKKKRSGRRR